MEKIKFPVCLKICLLNFTVLHFELWTWEFQRRKKQTKECNFCYCLLFMSTILIRGLKPNTSILCKIRRTTVCQKANPLEMSTFFFFVQLQSQAVLWSVEIFVKVQNLRRTGFLSYDCMTVRRKWSSPRLQFYLI